MDVGTVPKKRGRPHKKKPAPAITHAQATGRLGYAPPPLLPSEVTRNDALIRDMLAAMEAAWKPQSDKTVTTIYAIQTDVGQIWHEIRALGGKNEVTNNSIPFIHKKLAEIENRLSHHIDENARVIDASLGALQTIVVQVLDQITRASVKPVQKPKKDKKGKQAKGKKAKGKKHA